MKISGIKKRWIFNNVGIILGIFVLIIIAFNFLIIRYFHKEIKEALINRSNEVYNVFKSCEDKTDKEFSIKAADYINNLSKSEKFDVMIFDENDEIVLTSNRILDENIHLHSDYWEAKRKGIGIFESKGLFKNNLIALSRCIYNETGNFLGTVRYVVSLKFIQRKVLLANILVILIELIIIAFILFSSNYFIDSILDPINDICSKSKLIAQGNFSIKIEKKCNDEIGKLSDAINNMAVELKESEKLKNDFISSVSHELRTPLTAIKGWAETMQICNSDEATIKKGLETIVREAGRLSWIVEGMLDFSSLKEKRVNLIKEKIDILAELGEAVYMFRSRAQLEKKQLIYSEPKMISTVIGDRNRLKQIFINILDNAFKYTSEGGGISVSVSEKEDQIFVSVTDNGCGIPIEHLPNVTKKFYKANYLQRGSGIGLAIVEELVELHGGKLKIISEEGFGTTVTVSLPILKNDSLDSNSDEVNYECK